MAPCLVKNIDYYLTFDFYGYGGKKVKLVKRVHAKDAWPGQGERGLATVVKDDDGNVFYIHRQSYLFNNLAFRSNAKL